MTIFFTIDAHEVAALGSRFDVAASKTVEALTTGMATVGETTRGLAVTTLQDHTPDRTGRLRDSTVGEVAVAGLDVTVTLRQPAKSLPNQDGTGGGEEYVQWVIDGRGPIDVTDPGPFSTGKKALAGPGFGPVKHVGPAAADPYNEEAMAALIEPLEALLEEHAIHVAESVVSLL